jgi:hypothetical protein
MGCISIWENWVEEFEESAMNGSKGDRERNQSQGLDMKLLTKS